MPQPPKMSLIPEAKLEKLLADPCSGVSKKSNQVYHMALQPCCLANFQIGIIKHLNGIVGNFSTSLGGIVLAYGNNVQMKEATGSFLNEESPVHLDIIGDFFLFSPVQGQILSGVVSKRSESRLGLMVLGFYAVTIHRPGAEEDWIGSQVKLGQIVRFSITSVDLSERVPRIEGSLEEKSVSDLKMDTSLKFDSKIIEVPETEWKQKLSEIGKKRRHRESEVEDEQVSHPNKKIRLDQNDGEQEREADKKKKSKKKKKERKEEEKDESTSTTDEHVLNKSISANALNSEMNKRYVESDTHPTTILKVEVDGKAKKKKKKKERKEEEKGKSVDTTNEDVHNKSISANSLNSKMNESHVSDSEEELDTHPTISKVEVNGKAKKKKKKKEKDEEEKRKAETEQLQNSLLSSAMKKVHVHAHSHKSKKNKKPDLMSPGSEVEIRPNNKTKDEVSEDSGIEKTAVKKKLSDVQNNLIQEMLNKSTKKKKKSKKEK